MEPLADRTRAALVELEAYLEGEPADVVAEIALPVWTPATTEDIPAYYTHVRRGQAPPADLLADLTHRYAAIGGTSPLLERTAAYQQGGAIFVLWDESEFDVGRCNNALNPDCPIGLIVLSRFAKGGGRRVVARGGSRYDPGRRRTGGCTGRRRTGTMCVSAASRQSQDAQTDSCQQVSNNHEKILPEQGCAGAGNAARTP